MQQFKISPENLAKIKKKLLIRFGIVWLIALSVVIISSIISYSANVGILYTLLPVLFPILYSVFSFYRIIKKQQQLYKSYTLILDNNLITREQYNTPTISIYHNDITGINKNKNGTFTIKSKNPGDIINVPVQIENYNELEQSLNEILLITEHKIPLFKKVAAFSPLLFVGMMITVDVSVNKIVVAVCGTILVALAAWFIYFLQTNKNMQIKARKGLSFWLVVIVAINIYIMVTKLTV